MSLPLCTTPAEKGEDQDPVILSGRDADAVISTDWAEIHGIEWGPPA